MDVMLQNLAKKLNEYDEASLMSLWRQYAIQVQEFEPSKRWEEATLVFCLIQAVQMKNRLFNYHLLSQSQADLPLHQHPEPTLPGASLSKAHTAAQKAPQKATVLQFPHKISSDS